MNDNQKQVRFNQEQVCMTEMSIVCPPSPDLEQSTEVLSVVQLPETVTPSPPILPQQRICSFLLGERPQVAMCPHCKHMVRTTVSFLPGKMTFVMMTIICFAFFPLVWLPLCLDICKDAHHFCPDCCRRIGVKKRY